MDAPVALFRCDASPLIGAGHVMRCLALAEVLGGAGWRVRFAVGTETASTVPALAASEYEIHVLREAKHEAEELRERLPRPANLLVVDHYQRGIAFERACRAAARRILVLDDAPGRDHDCDILVDAGAGSVEQYVGCVPASARVLTGPAYALTRRSFLAHRGAALARRDGRPVKEILVSCGATDPKNVTAAVLDALDHVADDIAATVVLSSGAPHVDAVRRRLRGKARLLLDVGNMAELMTSADLAIGAAGSTAYERAVLGLPSILLTIAENQRGIARQMIEAAAVVDGGPVDNELSPRLRHLINMLLTDGTARRRLAEAASALVDGRGAERIAVAMLDGETAKNSASVRLRLAEIGDESWLLELQRQPQTRRYSRNPAIPGVEEHHRWINRTLADPDKLLLIVELAGMPVGSLRLDRLPSVEDRARHEIAIAIHPDFHDQGLGSAALRLVRSLVPGVILDAMVFPENKASQALFAKAGFVPVAGDLYRHRPSHALS